ncbi:type I-E CRISPR-associated protein Cas7/Cse4/CasC [Fibrella sp. HMF5335]|uniref:Type I-E CRISPR-associated protein Cas7/Cse4/CasC n=1 Tax=Fibrella rubiginis TaxID=2817060 RepID=A0A939K7J5_9BACT|nr:type I-E CRISPR-associated protein Cas7/Cse4/CasC [Fibrella rubiginis]MBO0938695.1 type I-E CRISPR-associated protein Cas7/Cse4/CasC [Fibrella rubiginis]
MKTIEFHILQNFPPSNLNRDDSGAPKDCDFGGYRRQRISSQCLKRSVRQSDVFRQQMTDRLGIRTKRAPQKVAEVLVGMGLADVQAKAMALEFFEALYGVNDKGTTDYLLYVGEEELKRAATMLYNAGAELRTKAEVITQLRIEEAMLAKKEKEVKTKEITEAAKLFNALAEQYKATYPKHVRAVDVALFGRMLADNPTENVDAACQVSHAISVNRMNMEFDYFTAVDDIPAPDDNAGAAMLGTVGFASSCFYRFACLDLDQLTRNLGGDSKAAHEGVMAFAEAFIQARPSGKQNTFAAHSLPAFMLLVVRENGQPVSLANAFEKPISPTKSQSLTSGAITALARHYTNLQKVYGLNGQAFGVQLDAEDGLTNAPFALIDNVPAMLSTLKQTLHT